MPKSLDKLKGTQKRKRTPNSSNANSENDGSEPGTKKKKPQKRSILEGIEMSKQLAKQVQQKRSVRGKSNRSAEPRLCGNGKPMPSLAELEAMYEDSDDDQDPPKPTTDLVTATDRCATPEQKPKIEETNLNSPTTLKTIASRVIDLISKKIEVVDDRPRPPVIPPKRTKKSGIPYIVGCKDRDQVPWAPKTKFCVGDPKYGVDQNQSSDEEDECCPKKRKIRGQKMNLSKSIFNAKSDEIAERLLKEAENIEQINRKSPDSDGTVDYEFTRRSFSPLPSTSMDSDTINKNHERFMESLQLESLPNESQNEVEVIEIPCETIILDNTNSDSNDKKTTDRFSPVDDDCCIIIEPEDHKNSERIKKEDSPEDVYYSSIDLTQAFDNQVYEVGDDDIEIVMAENQAILERDRIAKRIDSVTSVDPNIIVLEESTTEANVSVSNTSTTDVSISNVPSDNQNSRTVNGIAEVVTNFFRHPQHTDQSLTRENVSGHTSFIDLSQNTFRRISSWVSSFGLPNSCQPAVRNEVLVIEDSSTREMPKRNNLVPVTMSTHQPETSQNDSRKESQPSPQKAPEPVGRSLGDCPICMDSLENNQVASTMCGHVFCMACIKAAIQSNRKRCPTCRKVLKGVGYHQLFL